MALRQTYLSLKDKLPKDSESVLVMRGRGNDELAPSRELLEDFNRFKESFEQQPGYPSAFHYAWDKSHYEQRFKTQIGSSHAAMEKLREIAARARSHDVFFICYEGYDKPCHRKLLLEIAEKELGAAVDYAPFTPSCRDAQETPNCKREEQLSLL